MSSRSDLEFGRTERGFSAVLARFPIVRRGFARTGFRSFQMLAEMFGAIDFVTVQNFP